MRKRINGHFGNQGKQKETYFKNALKKYGRGGFSWQEIDSAKTQDELNEKERIWIAFYDSTDPLKGYNTNPGGRNYGRMPEVTRKKISTTRMGYPGTMNGVKHTPEAIEKIRLSKLGKKRKPMTAEARRSSSEARKGKKKSPETRRRMSEAMRASRRRRRELEEQMEAEAREVVV